MTGAFMSAHAYDLNSLIERAEHRRSESIPWDSPETLGNPPQICESCGEEIEEGKSWLSTGEHLLCEWCWKEKRG